MEKSKHDSDYGSGKGFTVSVLGSSPSSTTTASTNVHINKKRRSLPVYMSTRINFCESQRQECRFCSKMGHTTTRSTDCDRNPAKALTVQLDAVHPESVVQELASSSVTSNEKNVSLDHHQLQSVVRLIGRWIIFHRMESPTAAKQNHHMYRSYTQGPSTECTGM
eukprot:scaffold48024_cov45-Attheya_sp.AAC.1